MSLYGILLTKFESDRRPDRSGSWNMYIPRPSAAHLFTYLLYRSSFREQ